MKKRPVKNYKMSSSLRRLHGIGTPIKCKGDNDKCDCANSSSYKCHCSSKGNSNSCKCGSGNNVFGG